MNSKLVSVVILQLALTIGTYAFASPDPVTGAPASPQETTKCAPDTNPKAQSAADFVAPAGKAGNLQASSFHPKVVFQINQAADAQTILRFVTNYLIAEPTAEVTVVGYAGGVDFMLKGAKDAAGKPYADQLQTLADKGVHFKACNNTLKARTLSTDTVAPPATVVSGAVNEIIRLQTREGYAYFRH